MTTVLLVRHAEHTLQGRVLAGRDDSAPLSPAGREQLGPLGEALASEPVAAVHSSPRQRARETAQAIAARHTLPVMIYDALDELDYGAWTGMEFHVLEQRADWHAWNAMRASTSPPRGESMEQLQTRVLNYLEGVREAYPGKTVVIVTHAEAIRAALLHAMRLTLNEFARIDISTASITRLRLAETVSSAGAKWKVSAA